MMADLFPEEPSAGSGGDGSDESELDVNDESEDHEEAEPETGEFRDLALASEPLIFEREVTSAPSDDDQSETEKIVTEAVEAGASRAEVEANPAGEGPNVPPQPPTESFSVDEAEERETDMRQP